MKAPLLMFFAKEPTGAQIAAALRLFRHRLRPDASDVVKADTGDVFVSAPVPIASMRTPLMRPDGMLWSHAVDEHLAPRVRAGRHIRASNGADVPVAATAANRPPAAEDVLHEAITDRTVVVMFIRASTGAQTDTSKGLQRQFATHIAHLAALPVRPYSVFVAVEICSSSEHPVQDRLIFRRIRAHTNLCENRPVVVMTANADRLSRRAEEVLNLVDLFAEAGVMWLSQGVRGRKGAYVAVEADAAFLPDLIEDLRIGRALAEEQGHYSRAISRQTRQYKSAAATMAVAPARSCRMAVR